LARRRSHLAIVAVVAVVALGGVVAGLLLSSHATSDHATSSHAASSHAASSHAASSQTASSPATGGPAPSSQATGNRGGQPAMTTKICMEDVARVSHGAYIVQNNEFSTSAPECVATDGSAAFTVASSSIDQATNGPPGGYASIYQGCHWGKCSAGGLSSSPIQVSDLTTGKVTTSWSTTQPGDGTYDGSYDIWFNRTPTTSGQPNCTELMVWLSHDGSVRPIGSRIASNVSVGGHSYDIWEGAQAWGDTITYDMTTGGTSVSGLDVGVLAQDAVRLGYLPSSCYLMDIEAGFELWQGGAGLTTNSFSVNIAGH
jgi:hypothetical protein